MALPEKFIESIQDAPGLHLSEFLQAHEYAEQVVSIRINPAKFHQEVLSSLPIDHQIPWNPSGYYLTERPSFTLDPLFHAGAYYVQEASSMFLAEIMQQLCSKNEAVRVLDLCAAPGGKSTLLQSVIGDDALLVSNEVIKTRVNILEENICKWGAANVVVTNNDPKDFQRLPGYFDVAVVDAPCSGSGLFRKDAEAMTEWSLQHVDLCAQRQKRILSDMMPCIKENGLLIYSTCSYSVAEDEAICDWLMSEFQMESVGIQLNLEWNIVETRSSVGGALGYRFYPDRLKGEGFFVAVFRKKNEEWNQPDSMKLPFLPMTAKQIPVLAAFSLEPDHLFVDSRNNDLYFFLPQLRESLAVIMKALYVKKAGVKLGQIIRDELIPDHALSMSSLLNNQALKLELDRATALNYLRSQPIDAGDSLPGWRLVAYQGVVLGWIKVLKGRVNNYYPKSWRILNK